MSSIQKTYGGHVLGGSAIGLYFTITFNYTDDGTITLTGSEIPTSALFSSITAYRVWAKGNESGWSSNQQGLVDCSILNGVGGRSLGNFATAGASNGYPVDWKNKGTVTLSTKTNGSTSSLFNANNRSSRQVEATLAFYGVFQAGDYTHDVLYYANPTESLGITKTFILDAPPNLSSTTATSTSRNGIYWTADTRGVSNSKIKIGVLKAQYSAYFSSVKVYLDDTEIYSLDGYNASSTTVYAEINSSIIAGTYTPKVVVTDTRGQVSEKTFNPITIQQYVPSTYDITEVQSSTASFFANKSTASVTIDNIVVPTGYVLEEARLTIGNNTVTQTLDGTETSITISMPLTETGTFTPDVYIKDSRGLGEHTYLNSITVYTYAQPTISAETARVTSLSNPVEDDEGANVLLTANITVADSITISEPVVMAGTDTANVVWYETYVTDPDDPDFGLSDAIDWNSYSPTSPVTIYGFSDGYGSTTGYSPYDAFQLAVTIEDSTSAEAQVTVSVPQAFFTVDFLAGGHGIAFGHLAQQAGFWCWMDMYLRGVKVPVIFIENTAPTSADGEDGDIWLQYT